MSNQHILKGLQTKISLLEEEIKAIQDQKLDITRRYNSKAQELDKAKGDLKKLTNKANIIVSEHAILRYLERVKEINIDEIKSAILTKSFLYLYDQLGTDGEYPNGEVQLVVKQGVVTTIKT